MAAAAVGLLLALAALLLTRAPARPPRRRRRAPRPPRRRPARRAPLDLGVVVTEVATRLRAGADVESAWAAALARSGLPDAAGAAGADGATDQTGAPTALLALAGAATRSGRVRRRLGEAAQGALPGTIAACRLTAEIGAPLAEVLDRCARGLTEAGQARAARAIALAGPRATARLLGWLPLLGLMLGVAVGADPLAVLLGGGVGTACLLGGVGLMVAGRRWAAALERAARQAGG